MKISFNPNYQLNTYNNKTNNKKTQTPNFTAMHADQFARNTLLLRVEKDIDWKIINDLITNQKENKVAHIFLTSAPNSKKLEASVVVNGKEYRYKEPYADNIRKWLRSLCEQTDELTMAATKEEQNPAGILKRLTE